MKKVVASLVLASLVSSSVAAVDVVGALNSGYKSTAAYVGSHQKEVLGAAGVIAVIAGTAFYVKRNPESPVANAVGYLNPRSWFSSSTDKGDEEAVDAANSTENNEGDNADADNADAPEVDNADA